ncbi:type I-E CRISPR-associated protein Cse2/CasB [Arsenicicoccus dermatophilus]|uniref:type I-E CRISPR-associated protein Cse2/CasB n=1 Tax=Arsenicicoccus dermatophilus TaxID=1076331 RepID=UPI001F4C9AE8|nr:type I-E CRISPR-associated protein Cse2/CasB [Arsenicicoccus dermatophilus]MCH8611571.1 type I-E CRISPR-associated protein Cse2/CasB [Arsenicicoccus dermatophilus]
MTTQPELAPDERPRYTSPLVQVVLDRRHDRSYAGWTASVRRAITPATEVAAYGATERFVPATLRPTQAAGLRRAAAICAGATGAPQDDSPYATVGRALARLHRAIGGNHVEQRVQTLPLLDTENAAISLGHLVDLCSQHHVPVNFHDLARTLTSWGDGLSQRSQDIRRAVVHDFYTTRPDPEPGTTAEAPETTRTTTEGTR